MERTIKRDGVSEDQVKSIIKSQINRDKRLQLADEIILNEGSIEDLEMIVRELHEKLISEL